MSIVVRCTKCGNSYPVNEQYAGRRFQCPQADCLGTIVVPAATDASAPPDQGSARALSGAPATATTAPPRPQAARPAGSVACGHCGGLIAASPQLAGRIVRCPHCQGQLQMPAAPAQVVCSPPAPVPAKGQVIVTATLASDDCISCPICGESVKAVAKRCKHCGETLDPVLRRAEEAERLAMQASRSEPINIVNNNNVAVGFEVDASPRRRRRANAGPAVAMEVLFGLFNIFGIGHFMNGNAGLGLLFMFGYWFLFAVNVVLVFFIIGIVTLPLTWLLFMVISPVAVASTPPTYYD